jgi:hypothetical protein
MASPRHVVDLRNGTPSSIAGRNREWQRIRYRRIRRSTVGFWLAGVILGTAGCVLGASISYHHPVARVLSALWWGIYFGCFGASIGALIGLYMDRTPAPPSQESEGGGKPSTAADIDSSAWRIDPAHDTAIMAVSERVNTRK